MGYYDSFGTVIEKAEAFDDYLSSHYLQLMLRSSLGKRGLILPNGVGVIDLDYPDEIKMVIHNADYNFIENQNDSLSQVELDDNYFVIKAGDRIGQITMIEHASGLFGIDTEELRNGGFGSTNKKE